MVNYFAVWAWRNGEHDGYVEGPTNRTAPHDAAYVVGYCGYSNMADALASVRRHVEHVCDGGCEAYVAVKAARIGQEAYNRSLRERVIRGEPYVAAPFDRD